MRCAFRAYFLINDGPALVARRARVVIRSDEPGITTDINGISIHGAEPNKVVIDGQLYIVRNGVRYTAAGQRIE